MDSHESAGQRPDTSLVAGGPTGRYVPDAPIRRVRGMALASLVLFALAIVCTVLILLDSLLPALGIVVAGGAALNGVVAAVSRRGSSRLPWLLLAVAGGVVAVYLMFAFDLLSWSLLGLAFVIGGMAAGQYALRRRPRESVNQTPVRPPQQPVAFVNPKSGGGRAYEAGLMDDPRLAGIRLVEFGHHTADLRDLVAEQIADGSDLLIAVGGDGTQALVAEGAAAADVPYACVPAGTMNHLAKDLGLDIEDPGAAFTVAKAGTESRMDLGTVNGRAFVNNVSFGAYPRLVTREGYRDDRIGTAIAAAPDLIGPEADYDLSVHLECSHDRDLTSPQVIMVSNNAYRMESLLEAGSRASLSDGRLSVSVLKLKKPRDLVLLLRLLEAGGPARYPGLHHWEGTRLVVHSESATLPVGVDGEVVEMETPVEILIRPGALRVRVPLERPGQPVPAPGLNVTSLRRLTSIALGTEWPES